MKTKDNNYFTGGGVDDEYDEQTDGNLDEDQEYGAEIGFDENAKELRSH